MTAPTFFRRLAVLAALGLLVSGCAAGPAFSPAAPSPTLRSSTLAPYQTHTPTLDLTRQATPLPTATPSQTPTLTATPSPTPRTYTIKAGDDMSGIALRYRVKLEELKTANPSANPRLLKIGSTLVIPGTEPPPAGTPTPNQKTSPTATPMPVQLSPVRCLRSADGGAACFVLATNLLKTSLEGLSVNIRLQDASQKELARLAAVSPLDLLKAGAVLPLAAYFPPPLPQQFQASAGLAAVVPASEGEKRYVPVTVQALQADILPDGLSAGVSGEILSAGEQKAGRVRAVAIAYNAAGEVVGLRSWESSQELPPGAKLAFELSVYSAGGAIQRVEVLAEARP